LKDSYLTAGIKLGRLIRLLRRNRITYSPRIIFRLVFLLQSSIWSTVFSWIESARYARALKNARVPEHPIFIIGHWRTGTTFLHQLMTLDDNLVTPSLFQVAVPDSFLVSYPYYRPIFKRFVSGHRPMDQVKIGMDEPQEDEYAFFRLTTFSPLENLVFPKSAAYFLNHGSPFLPSGQKLEDWKTAVAGFYKKIYFRSGKRIVSKNPFNSFRIKTLCEIFPKARFIHLVRDPYDVAPSSMHLWKVLQEQNALNTVGRPPLMAEVTGMMTSLFDAIEQEAKRLPPGTIVRIRFEDLEKSPAAVLKTLYHALGLTYTPAFEARINQFMNQNQSFTKNSFTLTAAEKLLISRESEHQMSVLGYDRRT
jgi:hypothetical protein